MVGIRAEKVKKLKAVNRGPLPLIITENFESRNDNINKLQENNLWFFKRIPCVTQYNHLIHPITKRRKGATKKTSYFLLKIHPPFLYRALPPLPPCPSTTLPSRQGVSARRFALFFACFILYHSVISLRHRLMKRRVLAVLFIRYHLFTTGIYYAVKRISKFAFFRLIISSPTNKCSPSLPTAIIFILISTVINELDKTINHENEGRGLIFFTFHLHPYLL